MKVNRRWLVLLPLSALVAVVLVVSSAAGASAAKVSGSITVWVDAVRLPDAKAYAAAHPNVNVNIVTFDGDGNGATDLQTKIQLWNRIGSGWPDVVFSEQANDPQWMGGSSFNFAEDLKKVIPAKILNAWPKASTSQCTVNGRIVCLQDNLAQTVLWVNKALMTQFGYTVPKTWQQWAAIGADVATKHPGYIIGNIGDSYGHWIYLWSDKCPLETSKGKKLLINSLDSHCTRMASLLDPLIKSGVLPPQSVFDAGFAKLYGGANDKILMMPGPAWYGSIFPPGTTLNIPAGQMTASLPLQWNKEPLVAGQVGGGPWIISRHSKNLAAAADFVTWSTTVFHTDPSPGGRPGYPAYPPLASKWLGVVGTSPYFAANPAPALKGAVAKIWSGWQLVTYPDQPVWSNTVVTALVAGQSLSSLLGPLGDALAQAASAAGYNVTRK